jgi:hypothetical protein
MIWLRVTRQTDRDVMALLQDSMTQVTHKRWLLPVTEIIPRNNGNSIHIPLSNMEANVIIFAVISKLKARTK